MERFTCGALRGEAADHPHHRFGRVLGRQLGGLVAELHLGVAEVATEQHLVARRGLAVGPPLEAEEADVGDVVLTAAVRAAADVHLDAAHIGKTGVLEGTPDGRGEAA